jgi:hypothetical protein
MEGFELNKFKRLQRDKEYWCISVISATWEREMGRIMVRVQPWQEVSDTPSQQISLTCWHTSAVSHI